MYIKQPGLNLYQQQMLTEKARRASEDRARKQNLENEQNEFNRNALTAQRYALDQSSQMQKDPNNPRSVTDTSMNISNGRRGFGNMTPRIDGRYMSLTQFPQLNLDTKQPPREVMPEADFTPVDAKAFQDAAFARLKDRAGASGKSAIDSLAAVLGGRGVGNSGTFARGTANEIVRAVQPLSDLNVEHLAQEYAAAQRARELSEKRASDIYHGNITQRNQDIISQQTLNDLLFRIAGLKYQGEIGQKQFRLDHLYKLMSL